MGDEATTSTDDIQPETSSQVTQDVSLSNEGAKSLLDLLLKRGYLHDGVDPIRADPQRGHPDNNEEESVADLSPEDPSCRVVFLVEENESNCCTYDALEQKLRQELERCRGRCALPKLLATLGLSNERAILRLLEGSSGTIFQQGDEILTKGYLDRVVQGVFDALLQNQGCRLVSDLASQEFRLPTDLTLQVLQERLPPEGVLEIFQWEQGSTLVSKEYLESYREEVLGSFSALQEPATISNVCHQRQQGSSSSRSWDVALVASWVQEACQSEQLPGDFHGGGNAAAGSELYTPHAHEQAKRKEVDELFGAQGYMTASRGAALGLSKSKMGEYIQQSFPSAVIVSESLVVTSDTILSPLKAVIQEAIATSSFVDLAAQVPADILEQEEDCKLILNNHILPALVQEDEDTGSKKKKKKSKSGPSSLGVLVISSASGGLFVSQGMIQGFQQKVLPGLIAEYGKERAEELDAAEVKGTSSTSKSNSKKKGRKGKKGFKAASEEDEGDGQHEDVVPLVNVVISMGTEYPELMETDMVTKDTIEAASSGPLPRLTWESIGNNSHEADSNSLCNEGLICELCRSALYSEELVASCQRAIELELKALQSARLSKASVSRKDAATKVRNVETAFEEAFVDACNLLEAQLKFLEYVESNEELVGKLKSELLQGCCADFTSRLTQYCLFKNEIDADMFQFSMDSSSSVESGEEEKAQEAAQPSYCVSPDLTARQYPKTFLRLEETADTDGKGPLPKLREVLPGSIGVSLARQWTMCGGACYQGGTKVDESGKEFTRPGDLEKFMAHVEENCLSLCGIPFKKLDKKSEKKFLFARRQRLLRLLEEAPDDDATTVLDLTILLLFQQVKNLVAFGTSLYPDILTLLTAERKIAEEVAQALTSLAESAESAVDTALIKTIRECGLSKDISKHKIIS